jgi:hemerythrin superfamily protein
MDAITLLKNDHKTVNRLFRELERAGEDTAAQEELVGKIVEELSVHAFIEEEVFYPAARREVPETLDHVLESLEEHHIVKWVCSELLQMDPSDDHYLPKAIVLSELIRHHVEEEEQEFFPEVRKALGRKRLGEIGEEMEAARLSAPTSPDPQPIANR